MTQIAAIPNMNVSALYIALLVLLVVPLIVRVIMLRNAYKVSIGDGGKPDLALAIRIHGNYAENAAFALALLLTLPLVGAAAWLIHLVGLAYLAGRVSHILGLKGDRVTAFRGAGVMLTFVAYLAGGLGILGRLLF